MLLSLACLATRAQSYYDGLRICWDYRTQNFLCPGVYSRLKPLSDGSLALVYSASRAIWIRLNRGGQWEEAIKVSADPAGQYDYTNSELLELADGRLMYAWNARALGGTNQPYKIMAAYSADRGRTWHGEQTLYVAGHEWTDGCWEPAMMQLPVQVPENPENPEVPATGEVQLFFANEHNIADNRQNITLLRSLDNCATWLDPVVVSFRPTSRDGMPVPLCLQDGMGLVIAIEDNGLKGNFKPVIIHSTLSDNWRAGTVGGSSAHRWSALSPTDSLASSVYAGAPYLIQLHSGETLLSCQSSEGRKSVDFPIMQTYVGNSEAKNFCCRSTPFPFVGEDDTRVQWCALAQTDDSTVMATASVSNRKTQNGIWVASAHIYTPMPVLWSRDFATNWDRQPHGLFIGGASQAQARIRSAWDRDSIYFHFQVSDEHVVHAPEGSAPWDADGVEVCLDYGRRGGEKVDKGMFRILVNVKGKLFAQSGAEGAWHPWTTHALLTISPTHDGYNVLLSVPWSDLGGLPRKKAIHLCFSLHNNDNGPFIVHENMSGGNPDRPLTWMRCRLLWVPNYPSSL